MNTIGKSLLTGTALALLMTAPGFAQSDLDDAVSNLTNTVLQLRGDSGDGEAGDADRGEIGWTAGEDSDWSDWSGQDDQSDDGAAGNSSSGIMADSSFSTTVFDPNRPVSDLDDGQFIALNAGAGDAVTTTANPGAEGAGAGAYGAPDTGGWGWIADPVATVDNRQTTADGDVWGYAGNEADTALGAASAGVALGNTASAVVTEDVSVQVLNDQYLDGWVESQAQAYFGEAGPVTTTATTYGNTFTAESEAADIGMVNSQTAGAGLLKSRALIEAAEYAESATATATTGANTATLSAEEGYAGMETGQWNDAEVAAEVEIKAAAADVPAAVGTALAVINNADLGTHGDAALAGTQDNTGDSHATVAIQAQGTYAAVGTATITGNNLNMLNEGGVGNFAANQSNSGDLMAQSVVDVGVFPGQSVSTAVGIGNNASANTTGPSSDMHTVQNNSGKVVGQALFTGGSGVSALSNATAYGNAATGTLCNCDGEMNAYNHQANTGPIRAHAYNLANDATVLTATSVAAGNTATYTVGSP